jgi:Na+/proline symporter
MTQAPLLGGAGLAAVLVYLCSLLLIGWYANRSSSDNSARDYYLAGSSLGFVSLFFTLYATQYSGNTLLAIPGKSYRNGFAGLAVMLAVMAIVLVYSLFAPRLSELARQHRFITVADFLRWRYRSDTLVRVVNLVLVITLISYALGNFKAIGLLLESASGGAISFPLAILLLALIMGIYESLGGMRGVVWTDILQGVLLLFGCLLIFFAVAEHSAVDSVTRLPGLRRELVSFFSEQVQWLEFISLIVVIAFGAAVYPQAIQRIYAARDSDVLRKSYRLMFFMPLLTTFPMILVGMSVAEWMPELAEGQSEQVIILAIQRVVEQAPALSGLLILCLAAALAAIMSTIDSALLSLGSIITSDWMGERSSRKAGRITSWLLMGLLSVLAIVLPQTIWALMVFKFELLVQLAPAIILGVRSKSLPARAALAGILTGATFVIANQLLPAQPLGGLSGFIGLGANLTILLLLWRFEHVRQV